MTFVRGHEETMGDLYDSAPNHVDAILEYCLSVCCICDGKPRFFRSEDAAARWLIRHESCNAPRSDAEPVKGGMNPPLSRAFKEIREWQVNP